MAGPFRKSQGRPARASLEEFQRELVLVNANYYESAFNFQTQRIETPCGLNRIQEREDSQIQPKSPPQLTDGGPSIPGGTLYFGAVVLATNQALSFMEVCPTP